MDEFKGVEESKINIQKSVACLYTNNNLSERETIRTIPCTISSERIKYEIINITLWFSSNIYTWGALKKLFIGLN